MLWSCIAAIPLYYLAEKLHCREGWNVVLKKKMTTLEGKGQYVNITFTTTYNYLVFTTKFLLFTTIVTSC